MARLVTFFFWSALLVACSGESIDAPVAPDPTGAGGGGVQALDEAANLGEVPRSTAVEAIGEVADRASGEGVPVLGERIAVAQGIHLGERDPGLCRRGDALVRGTKANQAKIDQMISQFAEHWDLERMAVVDRNILRLAVYELLWTDDVPPKVAINEAIEIAKKFGTKESSRFINGVLDRIHKERRPTV